MRERSKAGATLLEELKGRRVALTGASGFLGRHVLTALLEIGAEVRVLSRSGAPFPDAVSVSAGGLSDVDALRELVRDAELVIHAAGLAHRRPRTIEEERAFFTVNATGTETLLRVTPAAARFLYVSSSSVYGPGGPFREGDALAPRTAYGRSKELAEEHVLARPDAYVARPSMFFGDGAPGNLARLASLIQRGVFPSVASGRAAKSMCHVSTVVDALLMIAAKAPDQRTFNVSEPRPISMREIADALAGDRRVVRVPLPERPLRVAGKLVGGRVSELIRSFCDDAVLSTDALFSAVPLVVQVPALHAAGRLRG